MQWGPVYHLCLLFNGGTHEKTYSLYYKFTQLSRGIGSNVAGKAMSMLAVDGVQVANFRH